MATDLTPDETQERALSEIFHGDHRDADGDRAGLDDPTLVAALPAEPTITVWCSECQEAVVIRDPHAFVLGMHQRVCRELERLNGVEA